VKIGWKKRASAEVSTAAIMENVLKGIASAEGPLRLPTRCHHLAQNLRLNFGVQHGLSRHPAETFAKLTVCAVAHCQMSVRSPNAL